MSRDLNLCQFIGRLGNDPDCRVTQSGTPTATLNLACSDDYKDKNTGQKVEQTNWIRLVAFGRTAEIIQQYLKKGSKIYAAGKQTTRKWQNQSGQDQYTTEVIISDFQMLDSLPSDGQQGNAQQGYQQQPRQQNGYQQQNNQQGFGNVQNQPQNHQGMQQGGGNAPPDDFSDDIPFMPVTEIF